MFNMAWQTVMVVLLPRISRLERGGRWGAMLATDKFGVESRIMIDNPRQLTELLSKLEAALPLPAVITPELAATLRKRSPDVVLPRDCQVTSVLDIGDEGGIMCALAVVGGAGDRNVYLTSITHLDFDRRLPLAREIAAYQKHRVKKLRKQGHY